MPRQRRAASARGCAAFAPLRRRGLFAPLRRALIAFGYGEEILRGVLLQFEHRLRRKAQQFHGEFPLEPGIDKLFHKLAVLEKQKPVPALVVQLFHLELIPRKLPHAFPRAVWHAVHVRFIPLKRQHFPQRHLAVRLDVFLQPCLLVGSAFCVSRPPAGKHGVGGVQKHSQQRARHSQNDQQRRRKALCHFHAVSPFYS